MFIEIVKAEFIKGWENKFIVRNNMSSDYKLFDTAAEARQYAEQLSSETNAKIFTCL